MKTVGKPSNRKSHCQPFRPRNPSAMSRPLAKGAPSTCRGTTDSAMAVWISKMLKLPPGLTAVRQVCQGHAARPTSSTELQSQHACQVAKRSHSWIGEPPVPEAGWRL